MAETGHKIIKLKSGETLVAQVKENSKSHIGVFRPMEIKYMHLVDMLGRKQETMILVDWLKSTVENSFKIEKEFILGVFSPRPDIITQYETQLVLEDVGGSTNTMQFLPLSTQAQKGAKQPDSLQDMLADALLKDALLKDLLQHGKKINPDDNEDDIEDELIQDFIDKSRQEKMINERDDPNYGSSYCDWSTDVDDYLS